MTVAPRSRSLRVVIVGRGKVGRSFARALRASGGAVRLVAGRGDAPLARADLVVLCVPDAALLRVASRLPATRDPAAVVHTAGVLDPDHLAPARARGWHVGQAHPLVAAATARAALAGATLLIGGDRLAVRGARQLAKRLEMKALVLPALDRALWHAVAALVANGASALAAIGASLLRNEGVPERAANAALAALLASVARNVDAVGAPRALTGPVRRGDAAAVQRHLVVLGTADPTGEVARLYATLTAAQLDLARGLGEAADPSLARIAVAISRILPGDHGASGERA